jgi:guanylate kinase
MLGQHVLCDLDVQGADSVKKNFGDDSEIIFISPPSLEILRKRLEGRATEPQEIIEIRLSNAKKEMLRKDDYDHLVINDKLEIACEDLKSVIKSIVEG